MQVDLACEKKWEELDVLLQSSDETLQGRELAIEGTDSECLWVDTSRRKLVDHVN